MTADPTAPAAIGFPGQGGDWRAGVATLDAHPDHPLVGALADRLGTATWGDLGPGGRGSTPLHAGQSVLRRRARHQPRDGLRRGVGTMAHCGRWGRPSLPNPVPSEGGQP